MRILGITIAAIAAFALIFLVVSEQDAALKRNAAALLNKKYVRLSDDIRTLELQRDKLFKVQPQVPCEDITREKCLNGLWHNLDRAAR